MGIIQTAQKSAIEKHCRLLYCLVCFLFVVLLTDSLSAAYPLSSHIQVQSGHTGEIKGIVQSPGGSMFATISIDNSVRLWSLQKQSKGTLLRVLKRHTRPVIGITWNSDDTTMIATHSDEEVFLWNIQTGQSVRLLTRDLRPVSISFQSSNTYITVACRSRVGQSGGTILRFDFSLLSGWTSAQSDLRPREKDVIELSGSAPTVIRDVSLSAQHYLLVGCEDGSVLRFNYLDNKISPLKSKAIHGNIAIHSFIMDVRQARIFAVQTDAAIRELSDDAISDIRWTPGTNLKVLWVSEAESFFDTFITVKSTKGRRVFALHENGFSALEFTMPGEPWIMCSPRANGIAVLIENVSTSAKDFNAIIHIGRVEKNTFVSEGTTVRSGNAIRCVAIDPLGRFAMSGDNAGNVIEWDIRSDGYGNARMFTHKKVFSEFVHQICMNASGSLIALSGQDAGPALKLFEYGKNQSVAQSEPSENQNPLLMKFFNDTMLCAVYPESIVEYNASLRVVQRTSTKELGIREIRAASVSASDQMMHVVTRNGDIVNINLKTLRVIRSFKGSNPIDGDVFISTISGDSVVVWSDNNFLLITPWALRKFDYQEGITGLSYNSSSRLLCASLIDGSLMYWSNNFRQRTGRTEIHDGRIESVSLISFQRNTVSVSGSLDGSVALINFKNPSMIFYGYPFYRDNGLSWVSYTTDQRYDTEEHNTASMRFVSGFDAYALDDLYTHHYTPRILSQLVNTEYRPVATKAIKQPPLVRIINSFNGQLTDKGNGLYLTAEFIVRQSGLAKIFLYQNGKLLEEGEADFPDSVKCVALKTFELFLAQDTNRITVVILDNDGTRSSDQIVIVNTIKPKRKVLHVVSVGIDRYKDQSATLRFAKNDAESIAQIFNDSFRESKTVYDTVDVRRIYDDAATRTNVVNTLLSIAREATENDALIFYFAGHGQYIEGQNESFYTLVLHGVENLSNKNQLQKEGLEIDSLRDLLRKVRATRQLVILDACYSGNALASFERSSGTTKHIESMSRTSGAYVIASVQSEGKSKENVSVGHGIFTHSILTGLKGAAPRGRANQIDVLNLCSYLGQEYENGNLEGQKPQLLLSSGGISYFVLTAPGK